MRLIPVLLVALVACDHSGPFATAEITPLGPITTASDVPLTLNPGEDYWPTWTDDGKGILYQFSQPGRPDDDRCIGMLPAAGGTLLWTLCDNRGIEADSTNGFSAFALGTDGRLLYLESVSRIGAQGTPNATVLWLADTIHPFTRRAIATFPFVVGNGTIGWLSDAAWTGPVTFMALGQEFTEVGHCMGCQASDTVFANGIIVAGSTATSGVALQAIPGTSGAVDFSVADSGASVIFATAGSGVLQRVRLAGDSISVVATIPSGVINGVSCRREICVVTTTAGTSGGRLWSVDLTSGTVTQLASATAPPAAWYTAHLSPISGDVVLQIGGSLGYQRLDNDPGSNLHLFRGLVAP